MNTYGVTDRQVASILANDLPGYPESLLIEWDCKHKNRFMSEYMRRMPESMVAEVITECASGCHPETVSWCFTDPLKYAEEVSGSIYLYMEPEVQNQIERARRIIATNVQSDIGDGLFPGRVVGI